MFIVSGLCLAWGRKNPGRDYVVICGFKCSPDTMMRKAEQMTEGDSVFEGMQHRIL